MDVIKNVSLKIFWLSIQVRNRNISFSTTKKLLFVCLFVGFQMVNFSIAEYSRMYQTGDYASVQKGGIIQYEGRTDSQVKIRGHRVDLSEIEKNLMEIDGVKKGIVLCYHAGQMDQAILAFASTESTSHLHEMQIENILRNKLPEYMTPQVMIIDEVPLLVNGKIDRQSLLKSYENTNNNGKCPVVEIEAEELCFKKNQFCFLLR